MIGGDYFASGSFLYLKQILRWCKASSLAVCLDLHSVPGMGTKGESFTGHIVDTPEFFKDENYEKAYQVLRNLTISSHTDEDFSTGKFTLVRSALLIADNLDMKLAVVMIMVVNEPLHDPPPSECVFASPSNLTDSHLLSLDISILSGSPESYSRSRGEAWSEWLRFLDTRISLISSRSIDKL